jgi:cytochrome c553
MRSMQRLMLAVALGLGASSPAASQEPSLKDVMIQIVEPTSNAIFYISREPPQTDEQWKALQNQALMLLEVANSLTTPGRAKDKKQWVNDAKLLIDASRAAYAAATAKNIAALEDLNDPLYTACATCHEHYLPKR